MVISAIVNWVMAKVSNREIVEKMKLYTIVYMAKEERVKQLVIIESTLVLF